METRVDFKRTIQRSPGYPMLSLEETIEKAQILWDKDKNNPIPLTAAYKHLGYTTIGGYGSRVIAALKKFDLISERHNDIILTENAVDLILNDRTSEAYDSIIKRIALKPTIYEKLYNEYNGNLPSDDTLRIRLIKEHKFNPKKVDELIVKFRQTLEYAGLSPVTSQDVGKGHEQSMVDRIGSGASNALRSFDIPVGDDIVATLSFNKPPFKENHLEDVKSWIDFFGKKLIKTLKENNNSQG